MGDNYIQMIDMSSAEKWDSIVHSFKDYDVYSLSGYVKAFQVHGDGIPILFYYESETLRGFNVVMKRDIADDPHFKDVIKHGKWFDIITPYGYGGWLLEGNGDTSDLNVRYSKLCKEQNIVSEFVRFHPMWNNAYRMGNMYQVTYLGYTIAMNLKDEKTIWSNIVSKNRNVIRKAEKNGVTILRGKELKDFDTFKQMYNATMIKNQAENYYFFSDLFYKSIREDLYNNVQVFLAVYEDKPIAGSIMIYANGRLNYHFSGSDIEYRTLAPTNLILFEAAKWGSQNGMKTFHLGGGLGSQEDNLYKFKKAFYKGEPRRFAVGKKIFLADVYDELNQRREDDPVSAFFPEYRRPTPRNKE